MQSASLVKISTPLLNCPPRIVSSEFISVLNRKPFFVKLFAFILSKTLERKVWLFKSLEFEILPRNLYADCRRDSLRESNLEINGEQLSGKVDKESKESGVSKKEEVKINRAWSGGGGWVKYVAESGRDSGHRVAFKPCSDPNHLKVPNPECSPIKVAANPNPSSLSTKCLDLYWARHWTSWIQIWLTLAPSR